jgi:CDP-diacylglycerol---serine O-phosphatidyltransferase
MPRERGLGAKRQYDDGLGDGVSPGSEIGCRLAEPYLSSVSPPELGKPGRRRRRGIAVLPALFTLGNCLAGFASLSYAAQGGGNSGVPTGASGVYSAHFVIAGYFIFLAMLFDMFDGFVARLTRSMSDFGAELDSLADMVSFGIAPAFLSIHLIGQLLHSQGPTGRDYLYYPTPLSDDQWLRLFWVIAGIYVACTALRLARFNVVHQADVLSHMTFRGLPSPAAAALVAGSVIFFEVLKLPPVEVGKVPPMIERIPFNVSGDVKKMLEVYFPYVLPVVLLFAGLLMVSRFSYSHLINRFLRGRKKFRTLVGFLILVMLMMWEPQITILLGIYVYALSAPVMWLFRLVTGKGRAAVADAKAAGKK